MGLMGLMGLKKALKSNINKNQNVLLKKRSLDLRTFFSPISPTVFYLAILRVRCFHFPFNPIEA